MNKLIILLALPSMLLSCSQPGTPDPAQEAMTSEIRRLTEPEAKVTYTVFEKTDSTTFGQELAYRKGQFELRLSQNLKFYEEYKSKGMLNNMQKKEKAILNDRRVLEGLDSMAEEIAPYADDIAYYDYRFSGKAAGASGETVFQDYYACITPKGEVLCIESSDKGLHKSLGRVLPGYSALIGGDDNQQND